MKNTGKHRASVERIGILFWMFLNFVGQIDVQTYMFILKYCLFSRKRYTIRQMLVWYTKRTVFVPIIDIVHTQETFAVYNFGVQK